jgi:hypothetical protein
MNARNPMDQLSERDRLITRPAEPLPTPLDPDSPAARNAQVDPRHRPKEGQGTDPRAAEIDYSV